MRTPNPTSYAQLTCLFKTERKTLASQITKPLIALLQLKKTTVAKNCLLYAVACIALFISSCQKGKLTEDTIVNSASSATVSATAKTAEGFLGGAKDNNINYGAFICPPNAWGGVPFQLAVAGKLGVSCLRAITPV